MEKIQRVVTLLSAKVDRITKGGSVSIRKIL